MHQLCILRMGKACRCKFFAGSSAVMVVLAVCQAARRLTDIHYTITIAALKELESCSSRPCPCRMNEQLTMWYSALQLLTLRYRPSPGIIRLKYVMTGY